MAAVFWPATTAPGGKLAARSSANWSASASRSTRQTLAKLYPGGKAEYLKKFSASLDQSIKAGHILPEERAEILAVAAINYDKAP